MEAKLQDGDRVVMIEDVTTSGKSMEETVPIRYAVQADVEDRRSDGIPRSYGNRKRRPRSAS